MRRFVKPKRGLPLDLALVKGALGPGIPSIVPLPSTPNLGSEMDPNG